MAEPEEYANKKQHYLDRNEYHKELTACKKKNELSKEAISMFRTHAKECARAFYFDNDEDRKDAIASAIHDLWKYWRGFKECNVVQLKIVRNFVPGESIIVNIHKCKQMIYTSSDKRDLNKRQFLIGKNINATLANLIEVVEFRDKDKLEIFVDKIKNKITFMDKHNGNDLSIKSLVDVEYKTKQPFVEIIKKKKDKKTKEYKEWKKMSPKEYTDHQKVMLSTGVDVVFDETEDAYYLTYSRFYFTDPPNAFSYYTSVARNGILKFINKMNPKNFKNSNRVSIDSINGDKNGMFNL